jgi:hypothetical protein
VREENVNALRQTESMWAGAQRSAELPNGGCDGCESSRSECGAFGMSTTNTRRKSAYCLDVLPNAMSREELDYFRSANSILSGKESRLHCLRILHAVSCSVDIPVFSIYNESISWDETQKNAI